MTRNIRYKKWGINDHWKRIFVTLIIVVLAFLYSVRNAEKYSLQLEGTEIVICILYVSLYWEVNNFFFILIKKKIPHTTHFKARMLYQFIVVISLVIIMGALLDIINFAIPLSLNLNGTAVGLSSLVEKSLFLLAGLTIVYDLFRFLSLYEKSIIENEHLKKEALVAQYEVLKNQISPHFLFNSLNALMALIPKDTDLSIIYTQKLSNVYRQLLNYSEKSTISLSDEIAFIKDYIFIFQKRFGKKLNIIIDVPADTGQLWVMPFALQMLVENAVKHNAISESKPLTIKISILEKEIVVKNNLQKKKLDVASANVGLANIINRYKLLTGQDVIILETDSEFSVSVPLIFNEQG